MVPPSHPFVHRVFHIINHAFWRCSPYFWKHPYQKKTTNSMGQSLFAKATIKSQSPRCCQCHIWIWVIYPYQGNKRNLENHIFQEFKWNLAKRSIDHHRSKQESSTKTAWRNLYVPGILLDSRLISSFRWGQKTKTCIAQAKTPPIDALDLHS